MQGQYIHEFGYILVKMPNHSRANTWGYVYEHILVAEKKLGRPLRKGEIAHHKDRNPQNNAPDNIHVFPSSSAHQAHHIKERIEKKIRALGGDPLSQRYCITCGEIKNLSEFSMNSSKGKRKHGSRCKPCCAEWKRNYDKSKAAEGIYYSSLEKQWLPLNAKNPGGKGIKRGPFTESHCKAISEARIRKTGGPVTITCVVCGAQKQVQRSRSGSRFCSHKCAAHYHNRNEKGQLTCNQPPK